MAVSSLKGELYEVGNVLPKVCRMEEFRMSGKRRMWYYKGLGKQVGLRFREAAALEGVWDGVIFRLGRDTISVIFPFISVPIYSNLPRRR